MRVRATTTIATLFIVSFGCDGSGEPPMMPPPDDDAGMMMEPPPELELPPLWGPEVVIEDENPEPGIVEVHLRAQFTDITLGDGMTYEMMTYNGVAPGPAIHARVGDEVVVHFLNDLDQDTTIHWHGLRISDQMDGNPRIQDPVPPGGTFEYRFVVPEAGTYWYHPHVREHIQIERGLYGMLVVRDEQDPDYDLERAMALDDILVDPDSEVLPAHLASHPEIMHGRFGNVMLVNAHEAVEEPTATATRGDVERWRLVNTANARTMTLSIEGASFRVIGVDGGKLVEPYETDRIQMPVGQRYDLEVAYDTAGTAQLITHVLSVNADDELVEVPMPIFTVDVADSAETPVLPEWPTIEPIPAREVDREVEMVFDGVTDTLGMTHWRINGESHPEDPLFVFQEGETVRMTLRNEAGPEHPFHLHGQFFEIVGNGQPNTEQPGLKDTVLIPGLEEVEIIAYLDNPGEWMAHCHILEHAQLGMMGEIIVEHAE
jgi:FtsP/CotA-like multicopper oxidase with cupredoxin domain